MHRTKVHTSALCFIPPPDAQEAIQRLRQLHDRQIRRWPPHVNVCYPFVPLPEFEAAASHLASCLRGFPPFDVTFRQLRHFAHGKKSFTAWLDPEASALQWQELVELCTRAFPHCSEQKQRGFVPHLTVGQFQSEREVQALEESIRGSWDSVRVQVADLALISREGQDQPFFVHWRVRLGSGVTMRESPPSRSVWLQPGTGDEREAVQSLTSGGTQDANAKEENDPKGDEGSTLETYEPKSPNSSRLE
ncbi:hypothetical protein AB1Y20_012572 [Prymnesium parvum]|uniref:Uncharacterized protein n=1 Tax=Prymnesium parvum TaxID=97485 RepID=A0AB34IK75_PRYPA